MEPGPVEGVPFKEKVISRASADYPNLYEKHREELNDPYMQSALWAIMDVADARRRAAEAKKVLLAVYPELQI